MQNIRKDKIVSNLKYGKIVQYLMAFLLTISVPIIMWLLLKRFHMERGAYISIGIYLGINILLMIIAPRIIWTIIRNSIGKFYYPITKASHPKLYDILKKSADKTGIQMPKCFICDSVIPNAFALKTPIGYIATITQGLMNCLHKDTSPEKFHEEFQGVMAHEFGHIAHDDMQLIMYISCFSTLLKLTNQAIMQAIIQRGLNRTGEMDSMGQESYALATSEEKRSINTAISLAGIWTFFLTLRFAWFVLTYIPYLFMTIFCRVLQSKEYAADANSALVCGKTDGLERSLIKLQRYKERMSFLPAFFNTFFAVSVSDHWYVLPLLLIPGFRDNKNALKKPGLLRRLRNLLESHPLTYDRIQTLRSYNAK